MSNYYYQTRNGTRVRVRKGRNRVRIAKGEKISRATVRGAIPTRKGEIYGKGAIAIGNDSQSIKGKEGFVVRRRGGAIAAAGRAGRVKGGVAVGYKRGRQVDAVADYSTGNSNAEFEQGYYTRTRRGRTERVRKLDFSPP